MKQNPNNPQWVMPLRYKYSILTLLVLMLIGRFLFGANGVLNCWIDNGGKGLLKKAPLYGDFAVVHINSDGGRVQKMLLLDLQKGIDYNIIEEDRHENRYLYLNAKGTKLYFLSSRKTTSSGYSSYQLTRAIYEYDIVNGTISQVKLNLSEIDDDNTGYLNYFSLGRDSLQIINTVYPFNTVQKNKFTGEIKYLNPNDSLELGGVYYDYKNDRILAWGRSHLIKNNENNSILLMQYRTDIVGFKEVNLKTSSNYRNILFTYKDSDKILISSDFDTYCYIINADLKTGEAEIIDTINVNGEIKLYDGERYYYGVIYGEQSPYKDKKGVFRYDNKTGKMDTVKMYSESDVYIEYFFSR